MSSINHLASQRIQQKHNASRGDDNASRRTLQRNPEVGSSAPSLAAALTSFVNSAGQACFWFAALGLGLPKALGATQSGLAPSPGNALPQFGDADGRLRYAATLLGRDADALIPLPWSGPTQYLSPGQPTDLVLSTTVDNCTDPASENQLRQLTYTKWANKRGFTPPVYDLPPQLCTMAQDYATPVGDQLNANASLAKETMQTVEAIHQGTDAPSRADDIAAGLNYLDGTRGRLEEVETQGLQGPVDLSSIPDRIAWLDQELNTTNADFPWVASQGNLYPGAVVRDVATGRVGLTDWSNAHQQKPFYDVSRLAFTNGLITPQIFQYAANMLGRPLNEQETYALNLHTAAINTDYYLYALVVNATDPAAYTGYVGIMVQRMFDDQIQLPNMPNITLT